MAGEEEEIELSIPAHHIRVVLDDSKRTKVLKEILRSSVEKTKREGVQRQRGKFPGISANPLPLPKGRRDRARKRNNSAVSLAQLAATTEGDTLCADIAGVGETSQLLQQCGQRISGLCSRLEGAERQLKGLSIQAPDEIGGAGAGGGDDGPVDEIRIVDRPEESPSVVKARHDRVVYDFVSKHAHFRELEEFKTNIDKAEGYDGLRKIIPARFRHHRNMYLLDDNVFSEPGKITEAIWNRNPVHPEEAPLSNTPKTRLQMRMTRTLEVSTGPRRKSTLMRKDNSAPALLSDH